MVSDNLKHDKTAAIISIDQILSLKPTNAKIVNICSDEPSSQFKNWFVVWALDFLTGKHNYHWPLVEDQFWQDKTDVICVVPQPTYMYSRDQLEFVLNALDFVENKTLERHNIKQLQFP